MKHMIIIAVFILIMGCSTPQPTTIYKNITVTVQNHTIEYRNSTVECNCSNSFINETNCTDNSFINNADTQYILGLIRQIKRCEERELKYWNATECWWEVEAMNRSLVKCNDSLEEIREALD